MKFSTLFIVCSASFLVACGSNAKRDSFTSQSENSVASKAPHELIATDFVNALSQLSAVPASTTTVAMQRSRRDDSFTNAMLNALQQAGYATRWVENDGTDRLFQYRRADESTEANSQRYTYELAIGVVEMRRSYSSTDQLVTPLSPLYVRGTDASGIVLNDDIFNQAATLAKQEKQATSVEEQRTREDLQAVSVNAVPLKPKAQIQGNSSPSLALQNSSPLQVPADANPLNPLIARASSGRSLALPLVALPREENVFALGGSNFEDILAGHRVITEQVLTFANDSMRLGDLNKQLVERLVERFDPQTDMFSVIGCSMGPTAVRGGNAALALGRAGRVVEALRFAGVDDTRILDEGCWAGDGAVDNLPKRGVVLTLNREV